jgi:predicted nucleic acid-binding protein
MNVTVVYASALAAIMFDEPDGETVAAAIEGARLVAPELLGFEIVHVCLTKLRRHPEQRDRILSAFALQAGLGIERADVDHAKTLPLAEQTGLSGYDASYLWLALRLDAELVTLDRRLARAAAPLGVRAAPIPIG